MKKIDVIIRLQKLLDQIPGDEIGGMLIALSVGDQISVGLDVSVLSQIEITLGIIYNLKMQLGAKYPPIANMSFENFILTLPAIKSLFESALNGEDAEQAQKKAFKMLGLE